MLTKPVFKEVLAVDSIAALEVRLSFDRVPFLGGDENSIGT